MCTDVTRITRITRINLLNFKSLEFVVISYHGRELIETLQGGQTLPVQHYMMVHKIQLKSISLVYWYNFWKTSSSRSASPLAKFTYSCFQICRLAGGPPDLRCCLLHQKLQVTTSPRRPSYLLSYMGHSGKINYRPSSLLLTNFTVLI